MTDTNFYRTRRLHDGKVLLTVDSGDWVVLSKDKYKSFKAGKMDPLLESVLADKGIILKDKAAYAERLRQRYKHLFSGPSLHIVAVTKRCNIACSYCHANAVVSDDKKHDMTPETARKTVDFIFKSPNPCINIEFQGGEPILNFETVKETILYAETKKGARDLRFGLVSNLVELDVSQLDFLIEHKVGLCTSLDGPVQVHDANRGKGTYEKVVSNIKTIRDRNYPLSALMVATKTSLPYPKEIVDEYIKHGFAEIQLRPAMRLGRSNEALTTAEYIEFWTQALQHILELNKEMQFRDRFSTYLLRRIYQRDSASFVDLDSPCGAGISTLAYDHLGNIYSCDEGRQYELFMLGKVDDSYSSVFESRQMQSLIRCSVNDCTLCDACVWKPFCGLCPVCSYAETGNPIMLARNERCRILDAQFSHLFDLILKDEHNEMFLNWIRKA
jgi:uncharacterized protein